MGRITYQFAYDESQNVVCIDDITEELRSVHKYFCIGCGAEMIAKLGAKNRHHFAHKKDTDTCNRETYLHMLGKKVLRDKFYTETNFPIEFYRTYDCDQKDQCAFYDSECRGKILDSFNMKDFYDTCEEEVPIDNFVADLLLANSKKPANKPTLIEIKVSHGCSQEKINSGLRIIEITINDESDIRVLRDNAITEVIQDEFWDEPQYHPASARFINFKRDSKKTVPMSIKSLTRFVLFHSGSVFVEQVQDQPGCDEQNKRRYPKAKLELNMDCDYFSAYEFGLVAAIDMGHPIKNCSLCKYHRSGFDFGLGEHPLFCCMSKSYGTPKFPKQSDAKDCQYYTPDQSIIAQTREALKQCIVTEVK